MFLLPKPMETEEEFRARFVADPLLNAAFPEEVERMLLAGFAFRDGELMNSSGEWPVRFTCRHILPGLVNYDDMGLGNLLVEKETIDKMRPTFVGRPVFDSAHVADASGQDFKTGRADGVVTRAWLNPDDGWDWVEYLAWDPAAKAHSKSPAWAVSNSYFPVYDRAGGGLHNNIPFSKRVIDGKYTHLAIVPNPRYEGSRIVICNSKGGSSMKLFGLFGKGKKDELDPSKTVEVGGKQVALKDLIEVHNAKAAAAASAGEQLADDVMVEIDGKEVKLADLKNGFLEHQNALDEKAKVEAAAKKEADDKKAAELANAKKEEEARLAREKEEKEKNFREIENARLSGKPQEPVISTRREQAAEGAKRYGSSK